MSVWFQTQHRSTSSFCPSDPLFFGCHHFHPSHFAVCSTYCSVLSPQIYTRVFNQGLRFLYLLTCSFLSQVKSHHPSHPSLKAWYWLPHAPYCGICQCCLPCQGKFCHCSCSDIFFVLLNHVPVSASDLTLLFLCPDIHQNQGGDAKKKTLWYRWSQPRWSVTFHNEM